MGASDTFATQGFQYDADGNRTIETGKVSGTNTIPAANNRLTAITGTPARAYTFDPDGGAGGLIVGAFLVWFFLCSRRSKKLLD
jgi:hypothetical protein